MSLRTTLSAFAVVAAAAIAGCEGGSTSPPPFTTGVIVPTPTPTPGPTATPAPTPTPTPVPTATPTPSPTPTPVPGTINGSAISLAFTVAGSSQQFTVTEQNYSGPLTAANGSPSCAGIATFSPPSGPGPSATFTITAVAAGTCVIVVSDNHGGSLGVNITVTTTTGSISSKRRQ